MISVVMQKIRKVVQCALPPSLGVYGQSLVLNELELRV
jgi:hypothetical protein